MTDKILIVIPSLEPDEKLVELTGELKREGFSHILIVNDGSGPAYDDIFARAVAEGDCRLLTHSVNQGKGRAMKTAFNEFLLHPDGCEGVVTVDSDGQHRPADIRKCCEALLAHPDSLILGSRNFDEKGVPLDMGGEFDWFSPISAHEYAQLTAAQRENRRLLKTGMEDAGFEAYSEEWWHYRLKNEPYPETYFDFEN